MGIDGQGGGPCRRQRPWLQPPTWSSITTVVVGDPGVVCEFVLDIARGWRSGPCKRARQAPVFAHLEKPACMGPPGSVQMSKIASQIAVGPAQRGCEDAYVLSGAALF